MEPVKNESMRSIATALALGTGRGIGVGRGIGLLVGAFVAVAVLAGPASSEIDQGTAVEGCVGCHSANAVLPVGDVGNPRDAHHIDLDPRGPATQSGYRQLDIEFASVDVTGSRVVLEFVVRDENGGGVTNLFAADGRVAIARLRYGINAGDPDFWESLLLSERFTTSGGLFQYLGGGNYRYSPRSIPTTVPVVSRERRYRVADPDLGGRSAGGQRLVRLRRQPRDPERLHSRSEPTRDIVQTATCNGCHGVTSDTKLALHGGGRTEVEYCVTCHNPVHDPDSGNTVDMTLMIHKIHYGSTLTNGLRDLRLRRLAARLLERDFTKDVDDCTTCHAGGGADVANWTMVPTRHGLRLVSRRRELRDRRQGHGQGGIQTTNLLCTNCHPASGAWTESQLPVSTVHQGVARSNEAGRYRGGSNGFSIDSLTADLGAGRITVRYSVTRNGTKMVLQSAPQWKNGASLRLRFAWSTEEYSNEGSASAPAPAQPTSLNALDVGGAVSDLGSGNYQAVVDIPDGAFGVVSAILDGNPVADLRSNGTWVRIPVRTAVGNVSVERRRPSLARRQVVDVVKCNACHDAAGAGLSFHGSNRTSEIIACAACHNGDATDIAQRPANPASAPDGKREESIDFKRIIHGIHTGEDLENGLVLYGFSGATDFSEVRFIGTPATA